MAEEQMIQIVESALRGLGDAGEVVAAGQFMPRGHTGSMFAGGIVGDSLAGSAGGLADSIATVGGSMAGAHAHDATTGYQANSWSASPTRMSTDSARRPVTPPPGRWRSASPAPTWKSRCING